MLGHAIDVLHGGVGLVADLFQRRGQLFHVAAGFLCEAPHIDAGTVTAFVDDARQCHGLVAGVGVHRLEAAGELANGLIEQGSRALDFLLRSTDFAGDELAQFAEQLFLLFDDAHFIGRELEAVAGKPPCECGPRQNGGG